MSLVARTGEGGDLRPSGTGKSTVGGYVLLNGLIYPPGPNIPRNNALQSII